MSSDAPLVSVGLPTFNGERHIRDALDSLLAQDYPNLEMVVSDNGSSDGTVAIVDSYAARDRRIRLIRNDVNGGAPANFSRVFHESNGPYFMWAADDDRWEPTFVSACMAALVDQPDAVLACTQIHFVDVAGRTVDLDPSLYDNPDIGSRAIERRIERLLSQAAWYQVYGLMRRGALERTRLMTRSYGTDVILLVELAMQGPFVLVPQVLFHYRVFADRTEPDRGGWHDAIDNRAKVHASPNTYLQESTSQAVSVSSAGPTDKFRAQIGILRAAYLRPTPLRSRIVGEAGVRLRIAVRDRDLRAFVKYGCISLAVFGHRALRRVRRRRH